MGVVEDGRRVVRYGRYRRSVAEATLPPKPRRWRLRLLSCLASSHSVLSALANVHGCGTVVVSHTEVNRKDLFSFTSTSQRICRLTRRHKEKE